jgi:hypothetical protein
VRPSARAPARRYHALLSALPWSTMDLSHAAQFTDGGPSPPNFPLKNNLAPEKYLLYLKITPYLSMKSSRGP